MLSGEAGAGTEVVTKAWPHFDHLRLITVRDFLGLALEHGIKALNQVVVSSGDSDSGLEH